MLIHISNNVSIGLTLILTFQQYVSYILTTRLVGQLQLTVLNVPGLWLYLGTLSLEVVNEVRATSVVICCGQVSMQPAEEYSQLVSTFVIKICNNTLKVLLDVC